MFLGVVLKEKRRCRSLGVKTWVEAGPSVVLPYTVSCWVYPLLRCSLGLCLWMGLLEFSFSSRGTWDELFCKAWDAGILEKQMQTRSFLNRIFISTVLRQFDEAPSLYEVIVWSWAGNRVVGSPLARLERSYSILNCFRNFTTGCHINRGLLGLLMCWTCV